MMNSEGYQSLFVCLLSLLFGTLSILYGRKIIKNSKEEIPILFWVAIKLSSILGGKQEEIQKKRDLLTSNRIHKNGISYIVVGTMMSIGGVLGLVILLMTAL